MNQLLIKYFNVIAVEPGTPLLPCKDVNRLAVNAGYAVRPEACTEEIEKFLKDQSSNFNTTFYQSWQQVEDLSEKQMVLLQLVHYLSTYGTDFTGQAFTLNPAPEKWHFDSLTVIRACTPRELFDRLQRLVETPVALSTAFVAAITDELDELEKKYGWRMPVADVANRELRIRLYLKYGEMPSDPSEMVGLIVYAATGESMVVKNKATFDKISTRMHSVDKIVLSLSDRQIERLAEAYYRFKPIFLALRRSVKQGPDAREAIARINRIARIAHRYKRPLKPSALMSLLDSSTDIRDIEKALEKENNAFRLIKICNYLRGVAEGQRLNTYFVRNGKVFVRYAKTDAQRWAKARTVLEIAYRRLKTLVGSNAYGGDGSPRTVAFPEGLEIAAPVSDKQFLGPIPYGSTYELGRHSYIGVYWRNEWGTRDYDLWILTFDGESIGWSADHKNGNLLFSGDMTNADPEATEVAYCRGAWPDCTIRVSRYCGKPGSRFRIFFGTEDISTLPLNYMVAPESIRMKEDLTSDSAETTVGLVYGNKVYFTGFMTGDRVVPGHTFYFGDAFASRLSTFMPLKKLLLDSGFAEYGTSDEKQPDIDLRHLDKDSIFSIFAK